MMKKLLSSIIEMYVFNNFKTDENEMAHKALFSIFWTVSLSQANDKSIQIVK